MCEACTKCDSKGAFYQDEHGADDCKPCPAHTVRSVGSLGVSKAECLCEKHHFQPEGIAGAACIPCAVLGPGANCEGGLSKPTPKRNYWALVGWWRGPTGRGNMSGSVASGNGTRAVLIGREAEDNETEYIGMYR